MSLITPIQSPLLASHDVQLDLLRLDRIHPQISGNKWFKLKYNLAQAKREQKRLLVSFGGAYSNHLHALAFAGKQEGLSTLGYIRGEEVSNTTLNDCKQWGMDLRFISRQDYRSKSDHAFISSLKIEHPEGFFIPEGGSNELGLKGCNEILSLCDTTMYDYITCAVGTGTTLAGIAQSLLPHQHAIGFTAMKGGEYLNAFLKEQLSHSRWSLETEYAFGGFGKKNEAVIQLLNEFKNTHHVELDFVYTAKMMAGLIDKIQQKHFPKGAKILAIHTGGIQGNRSLS
jgi:1-aminocyclopropane-1-carboxylate deaminase